MAVMMEARLVSTASSGGLTPREPSIIARCPPSFPPPTINLALLEVSWTLRVIGGIHRGEPEHSPPLQPPPHHYSGLGVHVRRTQGPGTRLLEAIRAAGGVAWWMVIGLVTGLTLLWCISLPLMTSELKSTP